MRTRTTLAAIGIALSSPSALLAQSVARQTIPAAQDRISVVIEGKGPDVILILTGIIARSLVRSGGKVETDAPIAPRSDCRICRSTCSGRSGNRVAAPSAEAIADYILRGGSRHRSSSAIRWVARLR